VIEADFAAGCFWGVEDALGKLPGVTQTVVGYEGGSVDNPTYEQVCSHSTGHTETVRVTYDPTKINYQDLLKEFFNIHDPTQKDAQGANIGSNYRSVIFYHNYQQKKLAQDYINELQTKFSEPITTEVTKSVIFWPAEDYHQHYYAKKAGTHIVSGIKQA